VRDRLLIVRIGAIVRDLQERWASDPVIAERVDSIGVRVHPS